MLQQQAPTNQSSKLLDNGASRARLPPPGFSHMNAFGLGVPRATTTQTSKILPFMNNGNAGNGINQMPQSNWPQHHATQPNLNYGLHDQVGSLLSKPNHPSNKNGE